MMALAWSSDRPAPDVTYALFTFPDPERDRIFAVTAYQLTGKPLVPTAAVKSIGGSHDREPLPPGWDEDRVHKVLEHYEQQSQDEAVAEDEAAFENPQTVMTVPTDLVPLVLEVLARHQQH